MKLYYTFGVLEYKDYEFEVADELVIQYLTKMAGFPPEDIAPHFDFFVRSFRKEIHKNFKKIAKLNFEKELDFSAINIISFLNEKENSRKIRQAFLKREAKKMLKENENE